jgi:hypothetical protein
MVAASAVVLVAAAVLAAPPGADDDRRDVRLAAIPTDEEPVDPPTLDRLAPGDVLVVRVAGGVANASGDVYQCRLTADGVDRCTNAFPVLFDDDGEAAFQYQLVDPGGCGGTDACVVVVADDDAERWAYAFTIFGSAAPPPPHVALSPRGPYEPGDRVQVEVSSLAPGSAVRVAFCAEECGGEARITAGDDGTASTTVRVGERCRDCGVVVVAGTARMRVDVEFTAAPAPERDPQRLIAGLAVAAVFLLLAWRIIVGVDWTPASEAATPELDHEVV